MKAFQIITYILVFILTFCTSNVNPKKAEQEKKQEKKEKETLALLLLMQNQTPFKTKMKILIPAYFYDSYYWNPLLEKANENFLIVLNPNNGPGSNTDTLYDQYTYWMYLIDQKKAILIGYVYSNYGNRNINEVKNDIDTWVSIYPKVKGFFIDETSSDSSKINYYQEIYNYIKAKNPQHFVIFNHGVIPEPSYFSFCDIDIVFENSPDKINDYKPNDAMLSLNKSKFAAIIHSAKEEDLEKILSYMDESQIGYIYITDDILPNPYNTLAKFWDQLTQFFAIIQ